MAVLGGLYVHERVKYLRRVENVWDHIASLRRVLALEPELLICDHAGILEDARGRLARKIQWWEDLAGKAQELRDQGLPVEVISRQLLGREGLLAYASLGDFSHRNLIGGPRPPVGEGSVLTGQPLPTEGDGPVLTGQRLPSGESRKERFSLGAGCPLRTRGSPSLGSGCPLRIPGSPLAGQRRCPSEIDGFPQTATGCSTAPGCSTRAGISSKRAEKWRSTLGAKVMRRPRRVWRWSRMSSEHARDVLQVGVGEDAPGHGEADQLHRRRRSARRSPGRSLPNITLPISTPRMPPSR